MKTKVIQKHTTIPNLYDNIAMKLGLPLADDVRYDCTKICVANNIQEEIFAYYEKMGKSKQDIAMMWLCYGPKAIDELEDDEVEVEEGWYIRDED